MRLKDSIDIASRPTGIVSQRHRRTTEDIDIPDNAAAGQPVAEPTESILNGGPIEQRIIGAHATPNSWAATYTPRRRNAAGAWTNASTRAARVLNGNHNRRSDLDSAHEGAPCPSRAARCSASAARNTSQRSSPVPDFRRQQTPPRIQRYSSRNSAINRHRRDSSAPASKAPSRAKLSGWYAWPRPRSSTLTTVVHSQARSPVPTTRSYPCPGGRPARSATGFEVPRLRRTDFRVYEPSRYPSVRLDLSVVVPAGIAIGDLLNKVVCPCGNGRRPIRQATRGRGRNRA